MSDSKYFTTTKKGEIFELKSELNSDKKERKREAVKKTIANMTVGKDVSALFPDVINCIQTDNLGIALFYYKICLVALEHSKLSSFPKNVFFLQKCYIILFFSKKFQMFLNE